MATKPSTLYVPDQEDINRATDEAIQRLLDSLDARKNRMFDPTLLAMAEGFLSPTKTGGFGESLGMAAGKVGAAETQRAKEEQEFAQMQLNIAQMKAEQARQKGLETTANRVLFGAPRAVPSSAPPSGAAPSGTPTMGGASTAAAAPGAAPSSAAPSGRVDQGIQVAPPGSPEMSREEFFALGRLEGKSPTDLIKSWAEIENKRQQFKEGYIYDQASGKMYLVPTADRVPTTVAGYEGVYNLPKSVVLELDRLMSSGDVESYKKRAAQILGFGFEKTVEKPGETAKASPIDKAIDQFSSGSPSRMQSQAELEAQSAAGKETAMARAKGRASRTEGVYATAEKASQAIPDYERLDEIAGNEKNSRIWGALTNKDIMSQIIRLAESGVGMSGFHLGIPAIREIAMNLKLTPDEMKAFQLAGQIMTKMQLDASVAQKGAVSDYERGLLAKASFTADDTLDTIKAKLAAARRIAKYQTDLADALESTKKDYDSFTRSREGRDMYRQYINDLRSTVGEPTRLTPATPKPAGGFKIKEVG